MGYKDNYEAYINLSRKELQGLCKKHNLPANKCQSDLARSLASYFKKKNSSLIDTEEARSVLAEGKSQDNTSDNDHGENGNQLNKSQDAKVGNELTPENPIIIESSEEVHKRASLSLVNKQAGNTEEATDGIIDKLNSTSRVVLRDQDLIAHSPTKREEQVPPAEPSPDSTNLKPESPTKNQNQAAPSQRPCNDKSTIVLSAESSMLTDTTTRPASFQFFVASEEGINLFIDLRPTPTDWVQSSNGRTCMDSAHQSCSISSLVKDANSSLGCVLSENFQSESVPLASIRSLSDIPIITEKKSGHTQEEGEENTKMEFPEIIQGDLKEASDISGIEPDPLVPCQSNDKLAAEETDLFTKELSVLRPCDDAVVEESATGHGLISSSDALDDNSVPRASDNARSTPDKELKRALNQGSEELSQNKKHHVAEKSNKSRSFTRVLRSSGTYVEKPQQSNNSVLPRRSPRLK